MIISKKIGSLWQYYEDQRSLNNAGAFIDFADNNNHHHRVLFKFKQKEQFKQVMITQKILK